MSGEEVELSIRRFALPATEARRGGAHPPALTALALCVRPGPEEAVVARVP